MASLQINQSTSDIANDRVGVNFISIFPRLHPPGIYLTKREAECFYLLSRFSTVKKIAQILALSPRTVESYINQIKTKMCILYKSELIEKAIELVSMNARSSN